MAEYKYKDRNIARADDTARMEQQRAQRLERSKAYHCTSCTNCLMDQYTRTLKELNIVSSDKPITIVIDAEPYCPIDDTEPTIQGRVVCNHGNRDRNNTCSTCKHGEPVTCEKTPTNPKIREYTTLYLCRNPIQDEHYPNGTAMRSYLTCEKYESKMKK